jgi:biotin carboxyl carrier protein
MSLMETFDELGLDELVLSVDGASVELTSSGKPPVVESDGRTPTDGRHHVLAPSVGVVRLRTAEGDEVRDEDVVSLLEVWTSTVEVTAGTDGTVREVPVAEGTLVEYGQTLLTIELA